VLVVLVVLAADESHLLVDDECDAAVSLVFSR